MTKQYLIIILIFNMMAALAQPPQKMSYQMVIRDATNDLVVSTTIDVQISILQGSETGTAVFVETHTPTTSANGVAAFEIGGGTAVTGTMDGIDWSSGPYYLKAEADPTG